MSDLWQRGLPKTCALRATLDVDEVERFLSTSREFAVDTEGKPPLVLQVGTCSNVLVTHVRQFREAIARVRDSKRFFFWDLARDDPGRLGIKRSRHACVDIQLVAGEALGPYQRGSKWGLCSAYNEEYRTKYEKDLELVRSRWDGWPLAPDKTRYACMDVYATFRLAMSWSCLGQYQSFFS